MGKVLTLAELSEHNNKKDCWLLINGKVYDVTKFLDDHPGGDDVLLTATGKDATEDFEDVGHSSSARSMMDEFLVGEIDPSSIPSKTQYTPPPKQTQAAQDKSSDPPPKQTQAAQDKSSDFVIKLLQFLVPLLILGLAFGVRYYTKSSA